MLRLRIYIYITVTSMQSEILQNSNFRRENLSYFLRFIPSCIPIVPTCIVASVIPIFPKSVQNPLNTIFSSMIFSFHCHSIGISQPFIWDIPQMVTTTPGAQSILRIRELRTRFGSTSRSGVPLKGAPLESLNQLIGLREKKRENPRFHGKIMENLWFPVKIFP